MFKSTFKLLGIIVLLTISFIYTDKVATAIKEKDDIMIKVVEYKNKNDIKPIEPTINGDEYVLGYTGISIDKEKSYKQMKKINKFLENKIIKDIKYPKNNTSNMYNYYIVGGNPSNKSVALIFYVRETSNLNNILKALNNLNIKAAFFVDGVWLESNIDKAFKIASSKHELYNLGYNGIYEKKHINKINKLINNISLEKSKYCIKNRKSDEEKRICASNNMSYVIPNLYNPSIHDVKQCLKNGIMISYDLDKIDSKDVNILVNTLVSKGYNIRPLENILNEKKD